MVFAFVLDDEFALEFVVALVVFALVVVDELALELAVEFVTVALPEVFALILIFNLIPKYNIF